jgi:hypothetical protein
LLFLRRSLWRSEESIACSIDRTERGSISRVYVGKKKKKRRRREPEEKRTGRRVRQVRI